MITVKHIVTCLIILMGFVITIIFLAGCSGNSLFFNYGYNIKGTHVYYKQPFPQPVIDMENVDAATFKVISRKDDTTYSDNYYYGTDKHNVYYKGWLLEGSDGHSFQLLRVNYAKDKNQCYYYGSVIPGADPATFTIIDDDFSKDKAHIFRRRMLVDNDTSVFQQFDSSTIVRTANAVSVYEDIVPIPKGATFKYLGFNYFALDDQLYWHNDPMPGNDVAHFVALDNFTSKTSKHVYYSDKIIADADPASFKLLERPYGIDAAHIFFFERTIEGADVKTFEIINNSFQCSRDKNAVYHEDKKITKFTAADLANKNHCNNCNEAAVYFAE